MKCKHLLFDADGTLFDYDKSEENALAIAFELSGFSFKNDYLNLYRRINKKLWLDFETCLPPRQEGLVDPAEIKVKRFEELFNNYTWIRMQRNLVKHTLKTYHIKLTWWMVQKN